MKKSYHKMIALFYHIDLKINYRNLYIPQI